MRKSTLFLICAAFGGAVLTLLLLLHPSLSRQRFDRSLTEKKRLVRGLGITDLCLFTEARYTRHLSQADLHSAFQEHPTALDQFPSGSVVSPPPVLEGSRP